MTIMQAPPSVLAGATIKLLSGTTYTIDSSGFATVTAQADVIALQSMGFSQVVGRSTYGAAVDPTTASDNTVDYAPGSVWTNTTASPQRVWMCLSAATGAAVWIQISIGALIGTANSPTFAAMTLTGLLKRSSAFAVTAFSGGGQGSATILTNDVNNITVATASSAPYDSVKFQAASGGQSSYVHNSAANPVQLFGNGTDTINAFAAATGVTLPVGFSGWATCDATGAWTLSGFAASLPSFNTPISYNANVSGSGTTLTGANIAGGTVGTTLEMTGTLAAAANAQLPTVANLVAALPNAAIGQTYELRIMNSSSADFTWTVTTNTGWTLIGTMTIDQGGWRDFIVSFPTSLAAATLRSVGSSGQVIGMGFATDVAYNTNAATTSATLTGANISGGADEVTLNMTGTLGSGQNITLPTVANLVAAIPDPVAGQSYKLRIINSSSANFAWTLLTAAGWTFNVTTATILQNNWRDYYITLNSLAAATIQGIGGGTLGV